VSLTVLGILLAAQGLVGAVQYELKLPGQMVWVHVVLATLTWLVSLWAVATEGRIGQPDSAEQESIATIVAEWSQSVPAS
jgi:cytochrome c oxidase assembly protein subunit 15